MTALIKDRNTEELLGDRNYPVETVVADDAICFCGGIVAYNTSTGKAVPAADAENLIVLGIAPVRKADGDSINPRRGIFQFANSPTDAVTRADIGKVCYVEDDQTVNASGGTNKVEAGKIYDIDANGVYVDMREVIQGVNLGLTSIDTIGITYTANDPEFAATGAITIADGDSPTNAELLQLALELNAKVNALAANQVTVNNGTLIR